MFSQNKQALRRIKTRALSRGDGMTTCGVWRLFQWTRKHCHVSSEIMTQLPTHYSMFGCAPAASSSLRSVTPPCHQSASCLRGIDISYSACLWWRQLELIFVSLLTRLYGCNVYTPVAQRLLRQSPVVPLCVDVLSCPTKKVLTDLQTDNESRYIIFLLRNRLLVDK